MRRLLEMDCGDDYTIMWIYLMLLNYTFKMILKWWTNKFPGWFWNSQMFRDHCFKVTPLKSPPLRNLSAKWTILQSGRRGLVGKCERPFATKHSNECLPRRDIWCSKSHGWEGHLSWNESDISYIVALVRSDRCDLGFPNESYLLLPTL